LLGIAVAAMSAGSGEAGGLFVSEMGTPDLGLAAAGRASTADNAATAFGNPAGMTRLEGSHLLVGLQGGYGVVEFDRGSETTVSGGNGGNASGGFPGAGFYAVYSLSPDIKLGISTGSNFGGDVQYEKGWSGRYYATKDELVTFGVWPVAAYKVNDWLSIGGGAQIIYGSLNSKTAVRNVTNGPDGQIQLDHDDVGYGGIAGFLVEPIEGTRIGVTYTSKVKLNFKENPDVSGGGPVFDALDPRITNSKLDLGLTIPQSVMVSGTQAVTPDIDVMANVTWQDWSEFGKPTVEVTSTTSRKATVDLDYDDTWGVALGGRWRFRPAWTWSLGVGYDTSPINKSQRGPALPLDQQVRVGTGLQYALTERATIGAAYQYLYLGQGDIDRDSGQLTGRLEGDYSSNEVHFFNMTLSLILD
jgi:long-chain fatty acid transport protein